MSYICHCLSFISSRRHGEVFPHKHLSATTTKYLPLAFSETKQLLKHFNLIASGLVTLSLFITFIFAGNGAFAVTKADIMQGWNRLIAHINVSHEVLRVLCWRRGLYDKSCAKLYNDIIGGRVQLTINVLHVMWCVMNCHDTIHCHEDIQHLACLFTFPVYNHNAISSECSKHSRDNCDIMCLCVLRSLWVHSAW